MNSLSKTLITLSTAFLLAGAIGTSIMVNHTEPVYAQNTTTIDYGPFKGAQDGIWGAGNVSIKSAADGSYQLQLSDDFSVRPGPDLEVALVKASNIASAEDLMSSEYVSIGQLEKSDGSQTYALPEGLDPSDYESVVIYCEEYTVLFSSASRSN